MRRMSISHIKIRLCLLAVAVSAWLAVHAAGQDTSALLDTLDLTLRVFYKEGGDYEPLTYLWLAGKQASRFTVTFREPKPTI